MEHPITIDSGTAHVDEYKNVQILPIFWRDILGSLSTVAVIVTLSLAVVSLLMFVLYGMTAYVGPAIFGTGPWRRIGSYLGNGSASDITESYRLGYDRTLTPAMTELTAKVTGALKDE